MGKDKLRKFAEINTFPNVYQLEAGKVLKGKWAKDHFKNDQPVVVELACGKGEYAVNLAKLFPEKNFIGVDLKGNRIWRGAKTGVEEGISNLAFLRIQIEDLLDYFGEKEIDEIWITFADPQPQISRERKRLTSPFFLSKYKVLLRDGGKINLKTDNDGLYGYTKEKVAELELITHKDTDHLYQSDLVDEVLSIKTHYENIYLKKDKNINYIQFSFN
ncbi:tRNA (guanosine(46)-N7)-methyltransferase TrmB [Pedobacter chitinilyticus]|uniref:tRNA (guanine-N(7)-)-methyltransferase n=1 Tax=Pedobacter chitinilyticus TaxID=2233776 RepID=A0A443YUI9_9SPHI|nr:tRNA (guanosine(46)-N7)-methyltransferase TrmB [Pedobacter chitinilyticus]RWU07533.1 tRNA (guanosine(46)-N7)-methyltransferase TrmB [Pedobacter chitinilyticus]